MRQLTFPAADSCMSGRAERLVYSPLPTCPATAGRDDDGARVEYSLTEPGVTLDEALGEWGSRNRSRIEPLRAGRSPERVNTAESRPSDG
ncbi:hypothetical protein ACQPZF_08260 [Actinosynnema sp. CS-041913]|uniref:hypothetical protein n=1 Tax=Actinosynnema sp. CS-041913 TaxID=3239917 RepID=UPI003D8EEB7B